MPSFASPLDKLEELLTALSPKFRTLQWSFADCPTVAVTSRFVILSKNGNPYCVSHGGWASPFMISVAVERVAKKKAKKCLVLRWNQSRYSSRLNQAWTRFPIKSLLTSFVRADLNCFMLQRGRLKLHAMNRVLVSRHRQLKILIQKQLLTFELDRNQVLIVNTKFNYKTSAFACVDLEMTMKSEVLKLSLCCNESLVC